MSAINDFQQYVTSRWGAVEPFSRNWHIASIGLAGETGEVLEPIKKHFRDGVDPKEELRLEMGDVLHYLTVLASSYGLTLDDIASANMEKLDKRDRER